MSAKWQQWLIFGLRALVSAGLLYYLINIVDWPRVRVVLGTSNLYLVLMTFPISLFAIGCMAFRWRVLLGSMGVKIPFIQLFGYYLVGNCFNIFLPGVIGGDVVRATYCARQYGQRVGTITGIVILERLCGLIALFVMGGVVSFLIEKSVWLGLGEPLVRLFQLTGLFLVGFAMIAWYLGVHREHRQNRSHNRFIDKLKQIGPSLSKIKLTTLFAILAISALAQALDLFAAYVLARALGIELSLGLFFIIIPMTYLVTLLPISLGGVGVREGILSYLLTRVGVFVTDAVTLAFLIYLLRVCIGMMGGVWYIVGIKKEPSNRT